jgi:hypothetical protein
MCQDRINSATLNLTQEFLAEMLGTRRATINVAAITLQSAELIRWKPFPVNVTPSSKSLVTVLGRVEPQLVLTLRQAKPNNIDKPLRYTRKKPL